MSRKLENTVIQRYIAPEVVDHLASNYVTGLLNARVTRRVNKLRKQYDYLALDTRITYWEQKLAPLNEQVPELVPKPETWKKIQQSLHLTDSKLATKQAEQQGQSWFKWPSLSMWQLSSVFSLVVCVVLGFQLINQPAITPTVPDALSYIAVLESENETPQVVASTYGESKTLVLDILTLPDIDTEQSYELWVTSKTDNQTRSLGEIPKGTTNFDRQLSEAEWRLIADSSFLLISIEDEGGSALGEPSEDVISRGLCIRLAEREVQI